MEDIIIKSTDKTPEVNLIASAGLIEFKGKSIPENTNFFFDHLIDWIKTYSTQSQPLTTVKIQMEYFNTMTSKCLHEILKALEQSTNPVEIHWYYEEDDEDMLEVGEDYESIINLQFKMIEVEEF